jgi:hypothetical protein
MGTPDSSSILGRALSRRRENLSPNIHFVGQAVEHRPVELVFVWTIFWKLRRWIDRRGRRAGDIEDVYGNFAALEAAYRKRPMPHGLGTTTYSRLSIST